MPSFSFAPVAKVTKAKSQSKSVGKYDIILANIEGIVFMTLKGEYKVVVNSDEYNIASECYSCKGVAEIYEQTLTDDLVRVRHIRSDKDRDDRDRTMYLPFTAGCSVKGNIVRHKITKAEMFNIKKVYIDVDDIQARNALKYYRDHYNIIMQAISDRTTAKYFDDLLKDTAND